MDLFDFLMFAPHLCRRLEIFHLKAICSFLAATSSPQKNKKKNEAIEPFPSESVTPVSICNSPVHSIVS